jgi:hypothetical protein
MQNRQDLRIFTMKHGTNWYYTDSGFQFRDKCLWMLSRDTGAMRFQRLPAEFGESKYVLGRVRAHLRPKEKRF